MKNLDIVKLPKSFWVFFSSIRLTIYLVLIFVLAAFIGSFIIRDPFFESMNSEVLFKWLFTVGIENIGKLWWLYTLTIITFLLAINTIICNINRFSSLIKYRQKLRNRRW